MELWRMYRLDADALQAQCNNHVIGRRWRWTPTMGHQFAQNTDAEDNATAASDIIEAIRR